MPPVSQGSCTTRTSRTRASLQPARPMYLAGTVDADLGDFTVGEDRRSARSVRSSADDSATAGGRAKPADTTAAWSGTSTGPTTRWSKLIHARKSRSRATSTDAITLWLHDGRDVDGRAKDFGHDVLEPDGSTTTVEPSRAARPPRMAPSITLTRIAAPTTTMPVDTAPAVSVRARRCRRGQWHDNALGRARPVKGRPAQHPAAPDHVSPTSLVPAQQHDVLPRERIGRRCRSSSPAGLSRAPSPACIRNAPWAAASAGLAGPGSDGRRHARRSSASRSPWGSASPPAADASASTAAANWSTGENARPDNCLSCAGPAALARAA